MHARSHDLVAFTALTAALVYVPELPTITYPTAIAAFGMNFVGGFFPDIDQPTSDFWDNFRLGPLVAKVIVPMLRGHRHVTHSLFGMIVFGFGGYVLIEKAVSYVALDLDENIIWIAFMLGIISHILADMVTKAAVPLLWPLEWKIGIPPLKALRIKSGGRLEKFVIFPGLLLLNMYLLVSNKERVIELLAGF